ncbi:hypothetical protein FHW89_005897 [Mucilaginibacter sp. SG564]|nr:hypothetical protein [Mucilaginibacter sp. SG564]
MLNDFWEQGLFWSKDFGNQEQGLFLCALIFVPVIHKEMPQTTHPDIAALVPPLSASRIEGGNNY